MLHRMTICCEGRSEQNQDSVPSLPALLHKPQDYNHVITLKQAGAFPVRVRHLFFGKTDNRFPYLVGCRFVEKEN